MARVDEISDETGGRTSTRGQSVTEDAGRYQSQVGRCGFGCDGQSGPDDSACRGGRGNRPGTLAAFAVGRVRASQEALERALTGKVTAHHRFLLGEHLTQIEHLDEAIRRVSEE